jgi:hypothetical protein
MTLVEQLKTLARESGGSGDAHLTIYANAPAGEPARAVLWLPRPGGESWSFTGYSPEHVIEQAQERLAKALVFESAERVLSDANLLNERVKKLLGA